MSSSAISIRGLGKFYQKFGNEADRVKHLLLQRGEGEAHWVLRNVSLDVGKGEALGIVGRNGAGKSTLLKLISRTLTPSEGHASVSGRVATLLELGAGLHRDYTGRENARFSAQILGLSRQEFAAVAQDIESFADIGTFYDRRVSEYSSGMYARLAFAINIHCKPDILIIDEILSVGDIKFQLKCFKYLQNYRAKGGTLLFVSHDDSAVRALCDRTLWLDDGRVQADGKTDQVLRKYHTSIWQSQSQSQTFTVQDSHQSEQFEAKSEGTSYAPARDVIDPDFLAQRCVPGAFCQISLFNGRGQQVPLVNGGQRMEIGCVFELEQAITNGTCIYTVRNSLGQILFGDSGKEMVLIPAATPHRVSFTFDLPYMLTDEYILELFILSKENEESFVVLKSPPSPLPVHTVHISKGMANIRMKEVRLERPQAVEQVNS